MGIGSMPVLYNLPWCLWAGACEDGFWMGESLRARENSLGSGSGLVMSLGGDCPECGGCLQGGDGGFCGTDTVGRSAWSLTLIWLWTRGRRM
jgi:hypothetical protein